MSAEQINRSSDSIAKIKSRFKVIGAITGACLAVTGIITVIDNNASKIQNFATGSTVRIPERAPFQAVLPEGIQINLSKTPTSLLGGKK